MSTKFKHIFFDLDRTLWDYETNSQIALTSIFKGFIQPNVDCSFDAFCDAFFTQNDIVWSLFSANKIDKEQLRRDRFRMTLNHLQNPDDELAAIVEKAFVYEMSDKGALFPGAVELLVYLAPRYQLHILTNGFEESQSKKLENAGILHFFKNVITSDLAGHRKPAPEMFEFAFSYTGAKNTNSLMIGDDPFVDIAGAMNVGMEAVLYNTAKLEHPYTDTPEVKTLAQLPALLRQLEIRRN